MFQVRQCAELPRNPTAVTESHLPRFGLVPVPQFQELCSVQFMLNNNLVATASGALGNAAGDNRAPLWTS